MFKGMDHSGRKTEKRFELHSGSCVTLYCHCCAHTTQHLDITETAALVAVKSRAVHRWMKQGIVHWSTLPCGLRVICESSLAEKRRAHLLMQLLPFIATSMKPPEALLRQETVSNS